MKVSVRRLTSFRLVTVVVATVAFAPHVHAQAQPVATEQAGAAVIQAAAAPVQRAFIHAPLPAALDAEYAVIPEYRFDASRFRGASASVPTQVYSHGDPSAEEQYILEMLNRARANPTAEGKRIAETNDAPTNSALDYFNVDRNKLKSDYASYPVRPPLAFSPKLLASSKVHSTDMSTNNFQEHNGSNGSTFQQRIDAQNYTGYTYLGENIFAYADNLFYAHCAFQVDWGNTELGHRQNDMNFQNDKPVFTECGISVVHDSHPSPHVGPLVVTEDYGLRGPTFIVGVVYRDLNSNNFYDVGEGLANVTIMPSRGTYYAVTSTSGGYAIPITAQGSMTLTASGGGLGKTITKDIDAQDISIKVDFTPNESSAPAAVQLVAPVSGAVLTTVPVPQRWNKIAGATLYHVQIATDSAFANVVVSDSTITDSTKSFPSLQLGTKYYWHVRAKNAVGWGPFSERWNFRPLALPTQVTLSAPTAAASIATSNVEFSWRRTSQLDDRYWLEIATDSGFANVAVRDSAVGDTFRVVNGLSAGTTYYWHVKAHNEAGWGPFSAKWNATTSASGVARDAAAAGFGLASAAPNPVATVARIAFDMERGGNVRLDIIDGAGRHVATVAEGTYGPGRHEVQWDAGSVADGIYLCRISNGSTVQTMKIVVMR